MKTATATPQTEALWQERVRAWREEGVTAEAFAAGKPFAASTLRYWASRLNRMEQPRFLRVIPRAASTSDVAKAELLVEVGGVRIRVARGFDGVLLADVVRALSGAAQ
jgi:hypothetical protein